MKTLQDYVDAFGREAGPKLFRAVKSRAAYKGASTRRRRRIEAITGRPFPIRRPKPAAAVDQPLLPFDGPTSGW